MPWVEIPWPHTMKKTVCWFPPEKLLTGKGVHLINISYKIWTVRSIWLKKESERSTEVSAPGWQVDKTQHSGSHRRNSVQILTLEVSQLVWLQRKAAHPWSELMPQNMFNHSQCTHTHTHTHTHIYMGLSQWLSGKESTCNAGATVDSGSIPGSGRSPGGGHGNPL